MAADKTMLIEIRTDDNGSAKIVNTSAKAIRHLGQTTDDASDKIIQFNKHWESLSSGLVVPSGTAKSINKNTRAIRSMSRASERASTSTRKMTRSMGNNVQTSQAFLGVVQDSAFGIRGMANNIPFAIESFADLKRSTGSTSGALKGLVSYMTGPIGLTLAAASLLPWLGELTRGMDLFGDKTKYSEEQLEQLLEGVGELRGGFELGGLRASTEADIDRIRDAIALSEEIKTLQGDIDQQLDNSRSIVGDVNAREEVDVATARKRIKRNEAIIRGLGFQTQKVDELNDKLEIKQALLSYYTGELGGQYIQKTAQVTTATDDAALAVQKFNLGLINKEQLLAATSGLQQLIEKYTELAAEKDKFIPFLDQLQQAQGDVQGAIEDAGGDLPTLQTGPIESTGLSLDLNDDELFAGVTERARAKTAQLFEIYTQKVAAQGKARLAMAQQIEDTRFQIRLQGTTQLQALELRTQRKINSVKNNALITARQREQRITQIERQAANKRVMIAQMEEERKLSAKMAVAQMFTGQLQATFEESKAVAIATGTANAILSGINVAKTVSAFAPPPIPQIAGAAMAALQMAQVAKIKSVSLDGAGGGGGGEGVTSYRGFNSGAGSANNGRNRVQQGGPAFAALNGEKSGSREITIRDGFGNMVAKGQEEIDRKGGSNYLRGGV